MEQSLLEGNSRSGSQETHCFIEPEDSQKTGINPIPGPNGYSPHPSTLFMINIVFQTRLSLASGLVLSDFLTNIFTHLYLPCVLHTPLILFSFMYRLYMLL